MYCSPNKYEAAPSLRCVGFHLFVCIGLCESDRLQVFTPCTGVQCIHTVYYMCNIHHTVQYIVCFTVYRFPTLCVYRFPTLVSQTTLGVFTPCIGAQCIHTVHCMCNIHYTYMCNMHNIQFGILHVFLYIQVSNADESHRCVVYSYSILHVQYTL